MPLFSLINDVHFPNILTGHPTDNETGAAGIIYNLSNDVYFKSPVDGSTPVSLSGGGSGDITSVVAGSGLTGGATTGDATLNVIGGDGITANADEIEVAVDETTIELSATNGSGTVRAKRPPSPMAPLP